jgi:hypothetical protein
VSDHLHLDDDDLGDMELDELEGNESPPVLLPLWLSYGSAEGGHVPVFHLGVPEDTEAMLMTIDDAEVLDEAITRGAGRPCVVVFDSLHEAEAAAIGMHIAGYEGAQACMLRDGEGAVLCVHIDHDTEGPQEKTFVEVVDMRSREDGEERCPLVGSWELDPEDVTELASAPLELDRLSEISAAIAWQVSALPSPDLIRIVAETIMDQHALMVPFVSLAPTDLRKAMELDASVSDEQIHDKLWAVSFDPELQEDLGALYGKIYEKMQATIDPLALMKPMGTC